MNLDRNELLLLSRGGRVPRSGHPSYASYARYEPVARERPGPGRLRTLVGRLRSRPARSRQPAGRPADRSVSRPADQSVSRPALDTHQYLRLEFAVDDERRHPRR